MTLADRTRKPTGVAPWPVILLEGEEKAGKSWQLAEFSRCERTGEMYWIDIGEGAGDEYAAIEGADYTIVTHDGTWSSIMAAVTDVRDEARRAIDAGEPPVVLAIDTMTGEWDLLKGWATERARRSDANKAKLRRDPDAEIDVTMNYWTDAGTRHRALMTILLTFPGIVLVTARGKETVALDDNGRPINNRSDYKVEAQKSLAHDVTVWVRFSRTAPPMIVGARSVHAGVRPGVDEPRRVPQFSVEWLVFDVLRCDPATAKVRDLVDLKPAEEHSPEDAQQRRQDAVAGRAARVTGAANPPPVDRPAGRDPLYAARAMLDATSAAVVDEWHTKVTKVGDEGLQVGAALTVDDRERMAIPEGEAVTLDDLYAYVSSYWGRHKVGPRNVDPQDLPDQRTPVPIPGGAAVREALDTGVPPDEMVGALPG